MLKVDAVNQYYGGSHILRGLSFEAKVGEVTVVLGRNGVGKTTLLKSLMGLVPIKSGSISLDGQGMDKLKPYERVRRGVGYVPQGREIFGRLTVAENLQMGLASKPGSTPLPPQRTTEAAISPRCKSPCHPPTRRSGVLADFLKNECWRPGS